MNTLLFAFGMPRIQELLIIAFIIVHAFYVSVVRPNAAQIIEEQNAAAAADPDYVRERRVAVLIKDLEQEACFILMFWALAIMAYKGMITIRHRALLQEDLIPLAEGVRILPEDTRDLSRQIQVLPAHQRNALLPRALLAALHRFSATRNIPDAAGAAHAATSTAASK